MTTTSPPKQSPLSSYNGTVLILDTPSRFDIKHNHLLAGVARDWFQDSTGLHPDETEIRLCVDRSPFPLHTRHVILSGAESIRQWTYNTHTIETHGYSLVIQHDNEPYKAIGVHNIQDCLDFCKEDSQDSSSDDEEADSDGTAKDTSPTRRSNYPFWTKWSIKKLLGLTPRRTATGPDDFRIFPNLSQACEILRSIFGRLLYVDIECSRLYGTLDCVGFSVDDGPIYVVPIYRYNGKLAYTNAHLFIAALSIAMQRNTVVGHNISGFDLPYLACFYRVGFGRRLYDTMLANHRLFAEVEKSLGHVIGMWTDHPYHKDQIITPRNQEDEQRYWRYNAQDVARLKPIHEAQLEYAAIIGATESIQQVNRCIYPYTVMTLQGIRIDLDRLQKSKAELERRCNQLNRICRFLMGKTFNMASSKQCVEYFHNFLKFPVVAKSEKTGGPSLGKKALYQLAVKHEHPMIPLCLYYRKLKKDLSSLEFNELKLRY